MISELRSELLVLFFTNWVNVSSKKCADNIYLNSRTQSHNDLVASTKICLSDWSRRSLHCLMSNCASDFQNHYLKTIYILILYKNQFTQAGMSFQSMVNKDKKKEIKYPRKPSSYSYVRWQVNIRIRGPIHEISLFIYGLQLLLMTYFMFIFV